MANVTVQFNANGGSGSITPITTAQGNTVELPTSGFYRTGRHMVSWTKDSTSGTVYALGYPYQANANTVFYARWAANTYKVYFNPNGGSGTVVYQNFTYGVSQALAPNTFSRPGYVFLGWSRNFAATNPTYTDQETVVNLTDEDNGTVDLYAVWKKAGVSVKDNGQWKTGEVYAKVDGAWKAATVYTKVNGTWKVSG